MSRKFIYLLVAGLLLCTSTLYACSDDNDPRPGFVSETVTKAFEANFPNATRVEWEQKGKYTVADFRENGLEKEAWFDAQGIVKMTETDYGKDLSQVASEVRTALAGSDYAGWTVDDVKLYERTDQNFYVIEVETAGQTDTDLYYTLTGELIKAVPDTGHADDDITPDTVI